ncbi:hypothetical protein SSAG_03038 [Streptomyces sp. Mg1]|nr:hypothetical protein SSAG_03038 [Streptomyces sp. Mg1]
MQPAAQPDVGADVRGSELAARVGPVPMHQSSSSSRYQGGFNPARLPPEPGPGRARPEHPPNGTPRAPAGHPPRPAPRPAPRRAPRRARHRYDL